MGFRCQGQVPAHDIHPDAPSAEAYATETSARHAAAAAECCTIDAAVDATGHSPIITAVMAE